MFSLYAYLYFTGTSYKIEDTTRDDSTNIKKNIHFVTVKPEYKNEFRAIHVYMLVGIGALISLFLFIIVIQLCKKSSSSRKRNISLQSRDDNALNSETLNQTNQRGYNFISEQLKDHSYRSFEDQYAEINEGLEMDILHVNDSSMDDNNGTFASHYLNSQPTDKFEDTANNISIDDMVEEIKVDVNASNSYLKPIFVQREPKTHGAKEEKVYINDDQD